MATEIPYIFYLLVGIGATIGLIIFISMKIEKKRTEDLKQYSLRGGFNFKKVSTDIDLGTFSINTGHSRKIWNALEITKDDIKWDIFDYRYTIGYGKNRTTYIQTVFMATKQGVNLPKFYLIPEHIFHKIGNIVGYKDVDFDMYPVFSKKYFLKGNDEASIRQIFKPEILRYLERNVIKDHIEAAGPRIIYYKPFKRIKPQELTKKFEEVKRVVGMFLR